MYVQLGFFSLFNHKGILLDCIMNLYIKLNRLSIGLQLLHFYVKYYVYIAI